MDDELRKQVNGFLINAVGAGRYQDPNYLDVLQQSEDGIIDLFQAALAKERGEIVEANMTAASKLLATFHSNKTLSDAAYADMLTTVASWRLAAIEARGKV